MPPEPIPQATDALTALLVGRDWSSSFRTRVALLALECEQRHRRDGFERFRTAWAWATDVLSLVDTGVNPLTLEEIVLTRLRQGLGQSAPRA